MSRPSLRKFNQLRKVDIKTGVNLYAEGSCLIKFGNTHVLCTASLEKDVPRFLKNSKKGWVTAEYGMLPRSTHSRMQRKRAAESGRTQEISRLIGRSLRAAVDMKLLGERQIRIDCDVIQADGGTRTAAITGGFVALKIAIDKLLNDKIIETNPIISNIVAISCGIYQDKAVVDLDYDEDSNAIVDANFVLNGNGDIVEIQATGEQRAFTTDELSQLLELSVDAGNQLTDLQNKVLL